MGGKCINFAENMESGQARYKTGASANDCMERFFTWKEFVGEL